MKTQGDTARPRSPGSLDWRSFAVVVAAHGLAIAALVHVRPQVDRVTLPPPIFAEVLAPSSDVPAEPVAPPSEPVDPVTPPQPSPPQPSPPSRPVPVDPAPAPRLAVPETTPAPSSASVVMAPVDLPAPAPTPAAPASEPTRAGPDALAGSPDEVRRYIAAIMRQLNRHKTYPRELKKAKVEGTVVLEFTIDAAGRLLASAVKQGSGHPELDRAAMEMLARANPLPAIPGFMDRDELALAIPVEYSLITDR